MTAATITAHPETPLSEDVALITVSDGETYTTKLSSVLGISYSWGEDMSETGGAAGTVYPVAFGVSGRTITVHCDGVTDKKMYLIIKGRK